jgi:DNA-binding IclR family transcriptional regulator
MVWSGVEAISVEQVASPRNVKHTSPIGTRYGTHATSSVQVFLAHLPEAQLRAVLDRGLPQYSERTVVDVERYMARLAEARRRGWALNGETSLEEIGLAGPVRDHRDEIVAAVLLSASRFRVRPVAERIRPRRPPDRRRDHRTARRTSARAHRSGVGGTDSTHGGGRATCERSVTSCQHHESDELHNQARSQDR